MMRTWRPIVAVALLLSLGACAQAIGATRAGITTVPEFNQVFLEDVRNAKQLAERTDDRLALMCWSYLEEFTVANAPEVPEDGVEPADVVGALSAYQRARNVRRSVVEAEISDEFRINCGPMLTDSIGAINRIGISVVNPLD